MKIYIQNVFIGLGLLSFAVFGRVTPAHAASTLTPVQIQAVIGLLQAFGVDSNTIANVQAVLENQPTIAQPSSTVSDQIATTTQSSSIITGSGSAEGSNRSGCDLLDNNLQPGVTDQSTNGDVSQLQAFLSKDKNIYPEGAVTGYYGDLTLQAVQRWQAAHGIISSGDPESTGFGHIGPITRKEMDKEMEMECEQEDSQSSSSLGDSNERSDNSATSTLRNSESGDN